MANRFLLEMGHMFIYRAVGPLSINEVIQLAEALKKNTVLKELRLEVDLDAEGARHIAEAIKENKFVKDITFEQMKLSDNGVGHIAEALKTNSFVSRLSFFEVELGGANAARNIADVFRTNRSINFLALNFCKIGDRGVEYIADALKESKVLAKLSLYGNLMGTSGARHLADLLKTNTVLTELRLGHNNIDSEGVRQIASALKTNRALIDLDLGGNPFGDEGAQHIAEALKTNTALTTLHLWSDKIGTTGAHYIADALKENTALTELNLDWNKIASAGAIAILRSGSLSITSLSLSTNEIMEDPALSISTPDCVLSVLPPNLTSLDMTFNKLKFIPLSVLNHPQISKLLIMTPDHDMIDPPNEVIKEPSFTIKNYLCGKNFYHRLDTLGGPCNHQDAFLRDISNISLIFLMLGFFIITMRFFKPKRV